jgi:hypothetical protein
MGDASDNIPGVPGIGEKTAQALIREHGTIENVLANAPTFTKPKLKQSLLENGDLARLSRELAVLHTDVPLDFDVEQLVVKEPDNPALLTILRELELTSLLKYVTTGPEKEVHYRTIMTADDLDDMLATLSRAPELSLDTETTALDPMQADLVGLSFSVEPHTACYLPLGHAYPGVSQQLPLTQTLAKLIILGIHEVTRVKKTDAFQARPADQQAGRLSDLDGIGPAEIPTMHRITAAFKNAIEIMAPGGGFVLAPIDQLFVDTRWENVLAMIEAWKGFRRTHALCEPRQDK